MKHLLLAIIAILVPTLKVMADNTLFPYPKAPENLTTMDERCSYVIEHFWDHCNMTQAFSAKNKLQQAFIDYIQLIPYANVDVVHKSVDDFIAKVSKKPADLLTITAMAEGLLYSDTATIIIDEVYLPFAQAVADNKKIKSPEKQHYARQAKILSGSQVNMIAPDFEYVTPDGEKKKFSELTPSYVILFFNNPDCPDCMMSRVRLSADYNINEFIKKGEVAIVNIYPGSPDDEEWKELVKRMPENWIAGASSEVNDLYDMRRRPSIYYLNPKHKILSKSMTADQLLNAFRTINTRAN
ncbi:MAG: DUF5106 domain-containing protein [Clostridiales bacterium]|nr:DUF5106 domain-containing protein [Clostridiales bacterium]